jgi:hypothetical protein
MSDIRDELMKLRDQFSFRNVNAKHIYETWRAYAKDRKNYNWKAIQRMADIAKLKQMIADYHAKMAELGEYPLTDDEDEFNEVCFGFMSLCILNFIYKAIIDFI